VYYTAERVTDYQSFSGFFIRTDIVLSEYKKSLTESIDVQTRKCPCYQVITASWEAASKGALVMMVLEEGGLKRYSRHTLRNRLLSGSKIEQLVMI